MTQMHTVDLSMCRHNESWATNRAITCTLLLRIMIQIVHFCSLQIVVLTDVLHIHDRKYSDHLPLSLTCWAITITNSLIVGLGVQSFLHDLHSLEELVVGSAVDPETSLEQHIGLGAGGVARDHVCPWFIRDYPGLTGMSTSLRCSTSG